MKLRNNEKRDGHPLSLMHFNMTGFSMKAMDKFSHLRSILNFEGINSNIAKVALQIIIIYKSKEKREN